MNCSFIRIERVSELGKNGILKYITASGKAGTYILSCVNTFGCQVPVVGKKYEYAEQQRKDVTDDRYAFLSGPGVQHEQYSLEVIVPDLPYSKVRDSIGSCQASDQLANEADCGRWVERKLAIQQITCSDADTASACRSFRELVRASDPEIMYDLSHQDHVYACFLPRKDEFFEVLYSEPNWYGFQPPSPEEIKQGVPQNTLTITGGTRLTYYADGIVDENKSLWSYGNWIYFSLGAKTDLQSMRKSATSRQAQFKGQNIEIDDGHWTLTETYKNQAETETQRTVTVQLVTGRFKESFVFAKSGKEIGESSGRCLIVSSDYF